MELKAGSCSEENFALALVRLLFSEKEMGECNCRGVRGKKQLDPNRIATVKRLTAKSSSRSPTQFAAFWQKECIVAIDEGCRRLRRYNVCQVGSFLRGLAFFAILTSAIFYWHVYC